MTDPIARSDVLDQEILAIPADRVFRRRQVVAGFILVMAAIGLVLVRIDAYAANTHDAVTSEIPHLKDQVKDRDHTITQQEDVIGQATDAIILLQKTLRDHGIEPPDIVIRPKE